MMGRSEIVRPSIQAAVKKGLLAEKKCLPDWLLFDDKGIDLFNDIRQLPEYYPASYTKELLDIYARAIGYNFRQVSKQWNIFELVDSVAHVTFPLLAAFVEENIKLEYFPVLRGDNTFNISPISYSEHLSNVHFHPLYGKDFNEGLASVYLNDRPRLFLLNETAANMDINDMTMLLRKLSSQLRADDRLMLNLDFVKSPSLIEKSYHDYTGVTTLFHKNLLQRLNTELKADFNIRNFEYWPIYDVVTGTCKRYLVSTRRQTVTVGELDLEILFKPWETIFTGLSQKYTEEMVINILQTTGLEAEKSLFDHRRYGNLLILRSIS